MNLKNDPRVRNMRPDKIQFIEQMADMLNQKQPDEVLPFLLAVTSAANKKNLQFTDQEAAIIIDILMPNKTPEEQKKLETIKQISKILSQ